MVNKEFTLLCSRAWSLQLLAHLVEGNDARISPMATALGAGRTAISASVTHLTELGYLKKNSGHGHPLRPAYRLTRRGLSVGEWVVQMDELIVPTDWPVVRKSWTLPVLRLAAPTCRFSDFRSQLQPITDKALSDTLKLLGNHQWISRQVDVHSSPPAVSYSPQGTGALLVACLERSYSI